MKFKFNRFLGVAAFSVTAISSSAFAADIYKDSSNTDLNVLSSWSTASGTGVTTPDPTSFNTTDNWYFNDLTLGGSKTLNLGGSMTIGGLALDNTVAGSAAVYNVVINGGAGQALTLNGASMSGTGVSGGSGYTTAGIVLNRGTGGTMTINADIIVGATQQWVTSRGLTIGGNVDLGSGTARTLTVNTATTTLPLITGVISGTTGNLTKSGSGTLYLNNAGNSFGGSVTVSGGTLKVDKLAAGGSNSSIGSGSSTITLNGGTLNYVGTTADTTNRSITMAAGAAISNNGTGGQISFTAANVAQTGAATARTMTLSGSNANANTFGSILGDSGTGTNITTLAKSGTGTWVLTGANTYTGSTVINQGVLRITGTGVLGGAAGSTGDANNIWFTSGNANGTIEFETNANLGAADQIRFRNTSGTAGTGGNLKYIGTTAQVVSKAIQCDTSIGVRLSSDSVGGSVEFSGTWTNAAGRAVYLGGAGTGDNKVSGAIGGSGSLTKVDGGKWILSGTNTYTGATRISGGKLAVNGTLGNTSTTVENSGTLQGSGSTVGAVTVQNGGTLAPGNSIESLGMGALSLDGGSTYAYELQTNLYAGTPDAAGDLAYSSGVLNITAGAILTLTDLASSIALANGSKLTLICSVGAWNGGLFSYDPEGPAGLASLLDDSTFTIGLNEWQFNYNDLTGGVNYTGNTTGATNFVTMTVVPEPNVGALIGGLGVLSLLRRRRAS